MKTIVIDVISGIVVPIATLYVGYKININYTEKMEIKRRKEEKRKLEIEEVNDTKKSVERFNRMVISKYIDYDIIKKFYDTKVYGQHDGPDYVFSKDYVNLIKELRLDEEMNSRRI